MIAIGEAPQLLTEFGMQQIAPAVFSTVEVEPRLVEDWTHLNKAVALYDRAEHSPLATRFGQDVGVVILSWRSWTAWVLGYPEAAVADVFFASSGPVAELVGIEGGVVSGVFNLESSDVGASDRRPRHEERYHEV
jgi:hypothetical protein